METESKNILHEAFADPETLDLKTLFEAKLLEYNITKSKVFKILNIDKDVFEEILSGKAKQPNLINVVKIANFLELDLKEIVKAILKNQGSENIASIHKAQKVTFLVKNFDVKMLTKLGFFSNTDDIDVLLERTLSFFGYETIAEFEEEFYNPLFSKVKRNFSDKMKDFWIKSAYQCFKLIENPNHYNRERLKDLIIKIKPYSQDVENGLYIVIKALYNVGVTVIVQSYLSTTQVRGGTFIVNGKPCIVLTDFNKTYPTLWFTLLHELHHVLFDMEVIESSKYHLTGEGDLFLIEDKADSFARDFFFSEDKFEYIKKYITNPFLVTRFAKEQEIHPSFVYSWYIYYQDKLYGKNFYAAFKEFYPNHSNAIRKLNPIQWNEESLKNISEKIKSIFEIQQ